MIRAFFYLQLTTIRNLVVHRLRRLKQPKYLFGALFGAAYFYFFFVRHMIHGPRASSGRAPALPPAFEPFIEPIAAFVLIGVALIAWMLPSGRASLQFAEAEVAFLFPAPVARRTLIHFKLLKSQLAILASSLLFSLLSNRVTWLGGNALTHALGWWVVLSTLNLYLIGASFGRERLWQRGISGRVRLVVTLLLAVAALAGTWLWLRHELAPLPAGDALWRELDRYALLAVNSAPVQTLLFVPLLVVKPFFASTGTAFGWALGPALAVLAACYWWVIRSDVAFEEASIDQARKLAEKVAAVRAGDWRAASNQPRKPRSAPFVLAAQGAVAVAFLWKSLIAMGPLFRLRTWLIAVAVIVGLHAVAGSLELNRKVYGFVAIVALSVGAWLVVIGPMLMRRDLRLLITHFDLLKGYPLRGWQVVLGSLLSPLVLLAAWEWLLLLIGAPSLGFAGQSGKLTVGMIGSGALGIAFVLPPLAGLMLSIPFAATLFFPAWADSSAGMGAGGGGIEAMGQRLIFFFGYVVVLLVALVPAALCGGVMAFIAHWIGGPIVAILATTFTASAVLSAEFAAAVWWLGERFEQFDLSQDMPR